MIAFVRGPVAALTLNSAVLEVGGEKTIGQSLASVRMDGTIVMTTSLRAATSLPDAQATAPFSVSAAGTVRRA